MKASPNWSSTPTWCRNRPENKREGEKRDEGKGERLKEDGEAREGTEHGGRTRAETPTCLDADPDSVS